MEWNGNGMKIFKILDHQSSTSDRTESEVLSLIESDNDSDVEEMKVKKKWNKNYYFIVVIDKWKYKTCHQSFKGKK